jgi:hypothetical protein
MRFKTLALGAITGVSLTSTTLLPVFADGSRYPLVRPIFCDHGGENLFDASGGFSEFVSVPRSGIELTFGEADTLSDQTYVGARVDAPLGGGTNWSITIHSKGGNPFFLTEFPTLTGPLFTRRVSSYSNVNGTIQATFNGPQLGFGDRFSSVHIYDDGSGELGEPFTDTIDLSSGGIQVNSILTPVENMQQIGEPDCTGIFGNFNTSFP